MMFIRKITKPIMIIDQKITNCLITIRPPDTYNPAGLQAAMHFTEVIEKTAIRQMFYHMMRVKHIHRLITKGKLLAQIRPNINLG